jgi:hypothetical protein
VAVTDNDDGDERNVIANDSKNVEMMTCEMTDDSDVVAASAACDVSSSSVLNCDDMKQCLCLMYDDIRKVLNNVIIDIYVHST